MDANVKKTIDFLNKHLEQFTRDAASGSYPDLPKFDLYAYDYLQFAEFELNEYQNNDLEQKKVSHLINCVSNLKRALENQLDNFILSFNLDSLYPKKRMNFPLKIEIASKCGIIEGHTLTRINKIRNLVEHEYKIPSISDIEAFFDLVSAVVSLLQQALLLAFESELCFVISNTDDEEAGWFNIKLDIDTLNSKVDWNMEQEKESFEFTKEDLESTLFIFKLIHYLRHLKLFSSNRYIRSKLNLEKAY